jgi:membrane fusion protein, hemolysin D
MKRELSDAALAFAPGLLCIQESPPAPLPRALLYTVVALSAALIVWACIGKLDIIASADGRLVPRTYLKIVQPADGGIVKDILVHEGEHVRAGQVLIRMDPVDAEADAQRLRTQYALRTLQLRRIDAELGNRSLRVQVSDPLDLFKEVGAQLTERRQSYLDARGQAEEQLRKAERDRDAGRALLEKLAKTHPLLESQAESYESLGKDGYVPQVTVGEKQRAYLENTQDLVAQRATVEGLEAAVREASQQLNQVTAKYRSDLQNERLEATGESRKLEQDLAKQAHHSMLLELTAPQAGIVKDIATHTVGTVVSAGTVLLSVVPEHEPLVAEVLVKNDDVGFVHPAQKVKVKLLAYPFQKYGMLDGWVSQVWPDADEPNQNSVGVVEQGKRERDPNALPGFKALIALERQELKPNGEALALVPGMQIVAEIREGRRTVLEYILSPVEKTLYEGGRER